MSIFQILSFYKKNAVVFWATVSSIFLFVMLWFFVFYIKVESIFAFDEAVNSLIGGFHGSDIVNNFFIIVTRLFDPSIFLVWFFLLFGLLIWRNLRYEALFLFFGIAGGQTIKIVTKFLTDRPRPENPFELSAHESSFPSGHATTAVFFFLAILYLFTKELSSGYKFVARSVLILGALLLPFSRIFVQVHFFSDVVEGVILGIGSLTFTILVFQFLKEKHYC